MIFSKCCKSGKKAKNDIEVIIKQHEVDLEALERKHQMEIEKINIEHKHQLELKNKELESSLTASIVSEAMKVPEVQKQIANGMKKRH